jgi:menaquinone-dependent protoporphyrinogen oxidase
VKKAAYLQSWCAKDNFWIEKDYVMINRILVAYGSRAGSTREIADTIAHVLEAAGAEVDVMDVKKVTDISDYRSVIIGSAVRIGKLIPETMQFAQRFERELRVKPTAYFVVCRTMADDTPENRYVVTGYLEPLCKIKKPVCEGLFAGKIDHTKVEPAWRFLLSYVKDGFMLDGDFRDWDAVNDWARSLVPLLVTQRAYIR